MLRSVPNALLFLGMSGLAPSAHAHPRVDEGRAAAEAARFEEALDAFDEASESDLTRAELVSLLEGRALVHLALRDEAALDRDLSQLAWLDPAHRFAETMPPDLADRFAELAAESPGPLALEPAVSPVPGGLRITADPTHQAEGLLAKVRLWVDREGWTPHPVPATVPAASGARLHYFVEAVGPGGVVLASAGSREAPRVADSPVEGAPAFRVPATETPAPPPEARDEAPVWPWIVGGAGVAALVVAAIVLFVSASSDDTQPSFPEIP